jgi:hypothetical protein
MTMGDLEWLCWQKKKASEVQRNKREKIYIYTYIHRDPCGVSGIKAPAHSTMEGKGLYRTLKDLPTIVVHHLSLYIYQMTARLKPDTQYTIRNKQRRKFHEIQAWLNL